MPKREDLSGSREINAIWTLVTEFPTIESDRKKKIGDRYDASVQCHCQHGSLADVKTKCSSSRSKNNNKIRRC